jgi:hypothetical protein
MPFSGPFHRAQENILADVKATFLLPSSDLHSGLKRGTPEVSAPGENWATCAG